MQYGATSDEWAHFEIILGLGPELLPTVCDPSVAPSPRSAIKEHGRTPSLINREGAMAGIKDWPKHVANGEIKRWSADSRLGICLQTRIVRGIDIDVPDPAIAQYIANTVARILGFPLPVRRRENTGKRLLAVIVRGDIPKRRMPVDGGMVEFLGTGQMFVAAGARKDGSRYYWEDGLPNHIPEISREQYDALVEQLAQELAVEPVKEASSTTRQRGEHLDIDDPVATWLHDHDLVLSETNTGGLIIECPWTDEHTSGEPGDSSTMWFPAGTNGHTTGHFKCLHSHCEHRNRSDFLAKVGYQDDVAADFQDLGPDPELSEGSEHGGTGETVSLGPFRLVQAAEFAAQPSGEWIVKGLIPRAELGIFYGPSGGGKSFVMLDIAMAVARGVAWRGLRVRQGKVIYIAAEGGGGFRKRLKAYAIHHGIDLSAVPFYVMHASPNLLDAKQVKILCKAIAAEGDASLVIGDTFAQMTPGANENAAEDMGLAIAEIRKVGRAVGATVILVHHAGKDATKGARGWSGLRAAADFEAEITRDGDDRAINTTKQKDADDEASWPFRLETVPIGMDEDGDVIDSCVVVESDVQVEAGVGGGRRKAKPDKRVGPWDAVLLDTYQELAVGGDVLKTELVLRAANKRTEEEAGTLRDRKKNARRALARMSKGNDAVFISSEDDDYVSAIR